MLKRKLFCFFVFVCFAFAQAQEIFTLPQSKLLSRFRFEQLNGGVILIRATFDEIKDSLNFILDTGSGGISLDSATAKEFNIPTVHSDRTIRGIGGIRTVDYAMHHSLHLPGVTTDSLDFHINDYSLLSGVYGNKIDGIIGYSLIRQYIIKIDYDQNELAFYTPGNFRYVRGGTLLHPVFSNLPIQSADLRETRTQRHRFYLDTGGGLCLLLSKDYVIDSAIFPKNKRLLETVTQGLGGKKTMQITSLKELKIGPYKFKHVPAYIFDDEYNVTSYPNLGGLIGADILRHFNVTLNYPKGEIHLAPNSHFRDFFDYSYTGMELYAEGGKVLVGDVIKGGPADKAGLKDGDEVFAIDNLVGGNFAAIKSKLQNAGSKVTIVVFRGGKPFETHLKVDSFD